MGLRNPVVLAGVVGVGVPVLAAGVVAALTIKPGDSGPDSDTGSQAAATTSQSAPATTTTLAPPTLAATPDPVGFQPDTLSFVSATEGWLLGRGYPCTVQYCLQLRHTTDGGATWQPAPLPAPLHDAGTKPTWLHYTDSRNGWIQAKNALFATHDGGTTWKPVDPGITGDWSVTWTDDTVYLTTVDPGRDVVLYSSPLDHESWGETSEVPVSSGGGPKPMPSVTVVGSRARLVVYNRTQSGSRLVDGVWSTWKLPCGGNGPADWTALSERRLFALCGRFGPDSEDPATTRLLTSTDGGATFTEISQLAPELTAHTTLTAIDATHLVVSLDNRLLLSADGGETWSTTYTAPTKDWEVFDSEFSTDTTGFVIMVKPGGTNYATEMLTTQDGGHTWSPVTFAS
ncbi:WD40/YVTN/BNR-like repeat-containing protein [Nocardia heshunensis]